MGGVNRRHPAVVIRPRGEALPRTASLSLPKVSSAYFGQMLPRPRDISNLSFDTVVHCLLPITPLRIPEDIGGGVNSRSRSTWPEQAAQRADPLSGEAEVPRSR